jgi:hypothetical protein
MRRIADNAGKSVNSVAKVRPTQAFAAFITFSLLYANKISQNCSADY